MYILAIPDRQKRRTLGFLKQNWIDFEEHPSMEGFFEVRFKGMGEGEFRDISLKLKNQGVTLIGADTQLTERKIMKLTKLLDEQETPYSIDDDESSQGFMSNPIKDIIIDLKNILTAWEVKKYDSAEDRYKEYYEDIQELVDQYSEMNDNPDREDDIAMHKTMMDAPDLYEQKIRNKIRKEINKLLK